MKNKTHFTNLTSEIYSKDRTIDTLSLICIGAGAVALLAVLSWMGAIVDMFISLVDIV